jgi:hypothetical protein
MGIQRTGNQTLSRRMITKHTPGPWKSDGYYVRQSGTAGGRMIADVCYTGPHHTPPEEYPRSCRIVDEANANLIAAAPDLFIALHAAVETYDQFPKEVCEEIAPDWLPQAKSAIAKAKGEQV